MPRIWGGVIVVLVTALSPQVMAVQVAPVPLGQCCGFHPRFEIQRYPRYSRKPVEFFPRLDIDQNRFRSLLLPGLREGGYRLVFETVALRPGRHYRFKVSLESPGRGWAMAEAFAGTKKLAQVNHKVSRKATLDLNFEAASGPVTGKGGVAHVLKLWVGGGSDIVVKAIELQESDGHRVLTGNRALLLPDRALGVYQQGASAFMNLLPATGEIPSSWWLEDAAGNTIRAAKVMPAGSGNVWKLPLTTAIPGYFRMVAKLIDTQGKSRTIKRAYVVLSPISGSRQSRRFYGMCTEEEGLTDFIPAAVTADQMYGLMERIGVGSVRMFNPAMPGELSTDGIHYDFHALDAAIDTAHRHGMEILLELGSNNLSRLPRWLLTATPGPSTIDLRRGMRFEHQRKSFSTKGYDETPYLDLQKYRDYLKHLFAHLGGRVKNFEIWNEPGHKFLPEDFIRIVRITRQVQRRYSPASRLVGFSSTAYPMFGRGKRHGEYPGFLEAMLRLGGGDYVDVVSYHSRHAFNFLGKRDHSDPRTDYALRIRKLLQKAGYGNLPIWDTERGVPWSSPGERLDQFGADGGPLAWLKPFGIDEPGRQMPLIYGQASSQGVERVFWFNWLPGTETLAHRLVRESLFDAGLEPTPTLFVYQAIKTNRKP